MNPTRRSSNEKHVWKQPTTSSSEEDEPGRRRRRIEKKCA